MKCIYAKARHKDEKGECKRKAKYYVKFGDGQTSHFCREHYKKCVDCFEKELPESCSKTTWFTGIVEKGVIKYAVKRV